MYKATAKAEQFNTRSGSESTKGSRKGYSLLGGGVDPASVLNEREARESRQKALRASLKDEVAKLQEAKKAMTHQFGTPDYFKCREIKERAAENITKITEELQALKASYINDRDKLAIPMAFMDVCRDNMTKLMFQRYMDEAHRRIAVGNQLPASPDET